MSKWRRCLMVPLASLLFGCSDMRGQPFDPTLTGGEFYLCCTVRFSPELRAADSNYGVYLYNRDYATPGPMLTAGTRVEVVKIGSSAVAFRPVDSQAVYTVSFSYGRKQLTPTQYFRNILLTSNPMDSIQDVSRRIADAIRDGQLIQGMTKQQALMARSYPPAHRTPSLEADEWIYYETPGFVDRVVFSDGKIQSITRGPAPA
jgi:hypothetical protein